MNRFLRKKEEKTDLMSADTRHRLVSEAGIKNFAPRKQMKAI